MMSFGNENENKNKLFCKRLLSQLKNRTPTLTEDFEIMENSNIVCVQLKNIFQKLDVFISLRIIKYQLF